MCYKTIAHPSQHEIVIEKSRFIAHIFPAPDEATAREHIDRISKKHWDATHNCYAYIIGETGHVQKASDDGEPSGTAGVPILEVIKKNGLTDTLIIVTRYFGGIKLGAGGLVRAYTRSASEGLHEAQLLQKEAHAFFQIVVNYATWSRIEQPLADWGIIHEKSFTDKVTVIFSIPTSQQEDLAPFLDQWGSGQIQHTSVKKGYVDVPL